ncbi:MAG: thioredoxin-like domain-containing protein [Flavobacteriales bacterium]
MKLLFALSFFWLHVANPLMAQKSGYEVKVNIKGLSDTYIKLAYYFGDKQYVKDSARVDAKGNAVFKGAESLPGGIYLAVLPNLSYVEFIIDKEQLLQIESDTADLIKNLKIKGSRENEIFVNYIKFASAKGKEMESLRKQIEAQAGDKQKVDGLKQKQMQIDEEMKSYKRSIINQHRGTYVSKVLLASYDPEAPDAPLLPNGKVDSLFAFHYIKKHYLDSIDLKDDRLLRTPVLGIKIKNYIERITPQIPDSINKAADELISRLDPKSEIFKYTVYYITNTYERSKIMGMDAVFVHMATNYYLTDKAYWVEDHQKEKIRERVNNLKDNLIGKTAVNLKLFTPEFHQTELHKINKEYTIVYFWDPSCGHCKKVTPKLLDFYNQKKDVYDLEVFAVYSEADTAEWLGYLRNNPMGWVNAADLLWRTNFKQHYDIYATPVIYVLDRQKKIIAKRLDVEQLDDFLKNYSKNNKAKG